MDVVSLVQTRDQSVQEKGEKAYTFDMILYRSVVVVPIRSQAVISDESNRLTSTKRRGKGREEKGKRGAISCSVSST